MKRFDPARDGGAACVPVPDFQSPMLPVIKAFAGGGEPSLPESCPLFSYNLQLNGK